MEKKSENPHKGHRQKMKELFLNNGLGSMPDHNVLEMLLFFSIPQKNTNLIAHRLMKTFGSFPGVLKADFEALCRVEGMTPNSACLINLLLPVYKRFSERLVEERVQLESTQAVVDYIRPQFIDTTNEKVFVICFDKNHNVICTRELDEGDVLSSSLKFRNLATAVLETNAVSCILVHNHPSGIALPSTDDIVATTEAFRLLKALKVRLEDHIIITEETYKSMLNMPKYSLIFYDAQ